MNAKLDALVVEEQAIRSEARALRAKLAELNARIADNQKRRAEVITKTRRGAVLIFQAQSKNPFLVGPGAAKNGDKMVVTGLEVRRDGKVMVAVRYLEPRGASTHTYFYGTVKELWTIFKKTRERASPDPAYPTR